MIDLLLIINQTTREFVPLFTLLLVLSFVFIIIKNKNFLKLPFKNLKRKTLILLTIIFVVSLVLNLFVVPHFHRWYSDEPNTLERAKTLVTNDDYSGVYRHPIGWSFFLAITFLVIGVKSNIALYSSSILGSLTIINIFLISYLLTKKQRISLFAAFIYALIPTILRYSGSAVNNIPSSFFLTLAFVFMITVFQEKTKNKELISLFAIGLAVIFRAENLLLLPLYFFGKAIFRKKINRKDIYIVIIIIILILPNLLNNSSLYLDNNLAITNNNEENIQNWNPQNILRNKETFKGLIGNNLHPLFFSLLYIIGIAVGLKKRKKETLFILAWIIPLLIFFSAYFETPPRFLIGIYPFLAILSGLSIEYLEDLFLKRKKPLFLFTIIIIGILFIPLVNNVHNDVWVPHSLETMIPDLLTNDLREECSVVLVSPTIMKATTNIEAIRASSFIDKTSIPTNDCVLFFEDMFCDGTFGRAPECSFIKEQFKYEKYFEYSFEYKGNSKQYSFFKLEI